MLYKSFSNVYNQPVVNQKQGYHQKSLRILRRAHHGVQSYHQAAAQGARHYPKQAAEDLGVSQALLSHYEKGIRECGLDFVVRVADYYNVSCDYLLGRSAERNGMMLSAEDLPNPEKMKDNVYHGSVLPTMNKNSSPTA